MNFGEIKHILYNCSKTIDESTNRVGTSDEIIDYINELQQENQQLKDNWETVKDIIEDERMTHWSPSPLFLTELLHKMKELEKGKSE